jgi:hypothetical protein
MHAAAQAWGDEFERIEGIVLAGVPRSQDATPHTAVTVAAIDGLPSVLRDTRSALLVATTDQGNLVRMLVVPALRKAPDTARPAVPIVLLERFDTFDAGDPASRLARGKDLILFDGFQVDLDTGQVVPENQGGDLQFRAGGEDGPRLVALGKAKLYTLARSPLVEPPGARKPSVGRSVVPGDFTGRYRLFANGQWSGTLDLNVDKSGGVSGRFRSDQGGVAYPVSGQVAEDVPNRVALRVKLPRTQQDFDAYLWTEGKGAMAGTVTLLERTYGFFAVRDGGRFAPEGEDVGPLTKDRLASSPARRTVVASKGQYTLDGQARTDRELTDSLEQSLAADPATWVLLQVADDEPFATIERAFEAISAAGVRTIRLAPAD